MLKKLQLQKEQLKSSGEISSEDSENHSHPPIAYRIKCIEKHLPAAILVYNEQKRRIRKQGIHRAQKAALSTIGWKPLMSMYKPSDSI